MVIISIDSKVAFLELCDKTGSNTCICSCNGNLTAVQKAVRKVQQEETHVISHHFLIKHDSFFCLWHTEAKQFAALEMLFTQN